MFAKFFAFFYAAMLSCFILVSANAAETKKVDVLFFTSPYCGHCQHMKREFLQGFKDRNKDLIVFHDMDTTTPDGSIAYAETAKLYGKKTDGVPAVFIGKSFLIGYPNDIGAQADKAVKKAIEKGEITKMDAVKKLSAFKNVPDFMKFMPKVEENSQIPAEISAPSSSLPSKEGQPESSAPADNFSETESPANQDNMPAGEGVAGSPFTLPDGEASSAGSREFYRSLVRH